MAIGTVRSQDAVEQDVTFAPVPSTRYHQRRVHLLGFPDGFDEGHQLAADLRSTLLVVAILTRP